MSDDQFVVEDGNDVELKVGSRVRDHDDCEPSYGVIVAVSAPETDADEEGRSRAVSPRIYIHWDDQAHPEHTGLEADYSGVNEHDEHVYVIEDVLLAGHRSTEG
jgi:hypothetical protein